VLGDVSGKGATAAVVTALARDTTRMLSMRFQDPVIVLTGVHDALVRSHPDKLCTTLLLVVNRTPPGYFVTIANGDHHLPIRLRHGQFDTVGQAGKILGILDPLRIASASASLAPGDLLVLYTDGVTEARRNHELFGEDVETHFDGFRRSDHEQILTCLTDDVIWYLPGYTLLAGKRGFDSEIENENFVGSPMLTVDRFIEAADTVVATGNGEAKQKTGEVHRFAFCDVFTFAGDLIARVESYVVPVEQ
jgi:ketosteroid isomerase-like protein